MIKALRTPGLCRDIALALALMLGLNAALWGITRTQAYQQWLAHNPQDQI